MRNIGAGGEGHSGMLEQLSSTGEFSQGRRIKTSLDVSRVRVQTLVKCIFQRAL